MNSPGTQTERGTSHVRVIQTGRLREGGSGGRSGAMKRVTALDSDGIWVGMSLMPPSSVSALHDHGEQTTVVFVAEGECRIIELSEGQPSPHTGHPGDFMVIPPWTKHREETDDGTLAVVIRNGTPPIVNNLE